MDYISTRDSGHRVSAAQAIVSGLSPDGGLFLPESLPQFSLSEIEAMAKTGYAGRAVAVLSRFLTDFSEDELREYVSRAYAPEKFPPKAVAPVVPLDENAHILELFHGPTCAFKDFALQLLPFLLTASLRKTGCDKTVVILVATSGDTGKAALEGFADVPGAKICVFYPDGGTSNIQRLQMTTQAGENVMVFAAEGNFDDAQNGVKRIFTDRAYAEELADRGYILSSANSINWGRLVPQIAYYFSAYCELLNAGRVKPGDPVNIVVPTGNFGNILAAYFAKHCGLPVGKLVCASNRNNVLTDFITTGTYDRNRGFYVTTSPSMDILISSNLERLLYLLCGRDDKVLRGYMEALAKTGKYTVGADVLAKLQSEFAAGCADDAATAAAIRGVYRETGYLCDTHTAVAVNVYRDYAAKTGDRTPTVIASTASPFKFANSVLPAAFGRAADGGDFALLAKLAELSGQPAPQALAGLQDKTERFTATVEPAKMKEAVSGWLGI
ncbi:MULTISPECIES: threonine synthase [Anaerotruncus]|uniref:threonine synthase n=1 Tax=Anaerotruncus TaxID=244127 RepID=UPI002087F3F9|nr:threonine synthase [Anaerotruncus massiliensis (ex Togo et al. 2019)]GKH45754.1 threonine synthase [Oscillospiraceae bacterium]